MAAGARGSQRPTSASEADVAACVQRPWTPPSDRSAAWSTTAVLAGPAAPAGGAARQTSLKGRVSAPTCFGAFLCSREAARAAVHEERRAAGGGKSSHCLRPTPINNRGPPGNWVHFAASKGPLWKRCPGALAQGAGRRRHPGQCSCGPGVIRHRITASASPKNTWTGRSAQVSAGQDGHRRRSRRGRTVVAVPGPLPYGHRREPLDVARRAVSIPASARGQPSDSTLMI